MGTFKLSNGESFEKVGHNEKYLRILVGRNYPDGNKENLLVEEPYKSMTDKKVSQIQNSYDVESGTLYPIENIYLLAENEDYIDYKVVNKYDGQFAANITHSHKIMAEFNLDGWKKRLFFDWSGSGQTSYNFIKFVEDFERNVEDSYSEGKLDSQGYKVDEEDHRNIFVTMYTDEGEFEELEIPKGEFLDSLVNITLIEYNYKIVD